MSQGSLAIVGERILLNLQLVHLAGNICEAEGGDWLDSFISEVVVREVKRLEVKLDHHVF